MLDNPWDVQSVILNAGRQSACFGEFMTFEQECYCVLNPVRCWRKSLFQPCLYNLPIKLMPQSFFLKMSITVCSTSELSRYIFMNYTSGAGAPKTRVWVLGLFFFCGSSTGAAQRGCCVVPTGRWWLDPPGHPGAPAEGGGELAGAAGLDIDWLPL